MRFSVAILATVLAYTWVLAPATPRWTATLAAAIVVALAVVRASRAREWGLAASQLVPSFAQATAFTVAAGCLLAIVGWQRGAWHHRSLEAGEVAILLLWALGQQFALQIVLLREAQNITSRFIGILVAAALFASLHLPNPFLTLATFLAALAWCRIYDRHPNLMPLTLSHAILTVIVLSSLDDALTGRLRVGIAYFPR